MQEHDGIAIFDGRWFRADRRDHALFERVGVARRRGERGPAERAAVGDVRAHHTADVGTRVEASALDDRGPFVQARRAPLDDLPIAPVEDDEPMIAQNVVREPAAVAFGTRIGWGRERDARDAVHVVRDGVRPARELGRAGGRLADRELRGLGARER
jgi:hypothetical protein